MNNKDFCAFILTHGRPDNVLTYRTLRKDGYTGKIFLIIDNEDKTSEKYYENFGRENVIMFDKKAISKTFDAADNFNDRKCIVYARNACFGIAKKLGIKYFIQLDDDYTMFLFRINGRGEYPQNKFLIRSIDPIMDILLDYYKSIPTVKSICMAQGGDFIGGVGNSFTEKLRRKAMNTFICSTERPFQFIGRINEDVNTYTSYQSKGNVFLTIPIVSVNQKQTQTNSGGMTEMYLDNGTYVKSFYTVIFSPSCVYVYPMGSKNKRLHHRIQWGNAVPVILNEKYKKSLSKTTKTESS